MQNDQFINDFAEKLQSIGTLHALGDTWISFDSTVPAGGVPFCGQLVSRNLWADLYTWASTQGKVKTESEWQAYATAHGGNCPYYSSGDNDTNFRMPRFAAYFKGADSAEDGGKWIAEGLPNVEGEVGYFRGDSSDYYTASGAFSLNAIGSEHGATGNTKTYGVSASFNAQNANPIYGNSEHVTPETCTVIVGVYAVSIVSAVGSSDMDKIASAVASLESAVENRLKTSTVHVIEVWNANDNSSWYRKWSDGLIEQGGTLASAGSVTPIVFTTAFTGTAYEVFTNHKLLNRTSDWNANFFVMTETQTTSGVSVRTSSTANGCSLIWYARGY